MNTLRAYRADWNDFSAWCEHHRRVPLPAEPETVALYLADLAGRRKPGTVRRRLSSIAVAHRTAGHSSPTTDPTVEAVWAGIRRTHRVAPAEATPLLTGDLARMCAALPDTLAGHRDRAVLLVGFAAALRRSDVVALDAGDIAEVHEGLVVTLRQAKTDPDGEGRKVGVPYGSHPHTCPVRAVRAWRAAAGIEEGPLFRPVDRHGHLGPGRLSDRAVPLIIKRAATAAGLDPDDFSGHSLRAGFATAAAQAGVSERAIMDQTGHRSLPMVRRYIRDGSLFRDNAAAQVGL